MTKHSVNTAGLRLLSSVLHHVSITAFRDIDANVLFAEKADAHEQRVYAFIRRHYRRHSTLPTAALVRENLGLVLPKVDQPISYYLERARQRTMVRGVIAPYQRIGEALQEPRTSIDTILSAVDELVSLRTKFIDVEGGVETSDNVLAELRTSYIAKRMSGGVLTGIPTGYEPVDTVLDGYNKGDLVVWVGRPGRSKSWLLLKQAYTAWMAGYKPLYISMEMESLQNMRRMVGIHSGVNPTFIKRGTVQTLSERHLFSKMDELLDLRPMHMVSANFSRTVDQIANFIDKYSPDIVFIDAGYLLTPRKKRYGSSGRRETISDVIEELKELAANAGIPFVITVQFNRQAEARRRTSAAPRPDGSAATIINPIAHLSLAEIGETDVIGQAASHVLGIEYPPLPLNRSSYRVFGFLKGREGEAGWWLTHFMETQTSPINLDIVPYDDPAYALMRSGQPAPTIDPNRRMALLGLQE